MFENSANVVWVSRSNSLHNFKRSVVPWYDLELMPWLLGKPRQESGSNSFQLYPVRFVEGLRPELCWECCFHWADNFLATIVSAGSFF